MDFLKGITTVKIPGTHFEVFWAFANAIFSQFWNLRFLRNDTFCFFSLKLKLGFASGVKSVTLDNLQILSIYDFKNMSTHRNTIFASLQCNRNQKYWNLSTLHESHFCFFSVQQKSEILKRSKIISLSENQKILQNSSTKFLLIFFINFQKWKKSVKKWHFFKDIGTWSACKWNLFGENLVKFRVRENFTIFSDGKMIFKDGKKVFAKKTKRYILDYVQ